MSTRTVTAVLEAKVNGYTTGMQKAATETSKLERTVDKAETGSRRLGTTMAAVGAVIGGAAVVGALRSAITAASDLNETTSKTKTIFGSSSAQIEAWADKAATALGQSQQQAMDAAGAFAIFGQSAGLSGDQLVTFSTGLSELATDLASFYNTTPDDAITAIGAALRGEAEPIRRYGVLLDDATLKQEAMRQGLIKTTKDALTPQQRVLAAQAVILQQTTVAQGDFARTADGLANSQRILSAEWKNAQAELGKMFLPTAKNAVGVLSDLLGFVNSLTPAQQATVVQMALLGGAAAVAAPKVLALKASLAAADASALRARISFGLAATAISAMLLSAYNGSRDLGSLSAGIRDANTALRAGGKDWEAGTTAVEAYRTRYAELKDDLDNGGFLGDVKFALAGVSDLFYRIGNGGRSAFTDAKKAAEEFNKTNLDIQRVANYAGSWLGVEYEVMQNLARSAGVDLSDGLDIATVRLGQYYLATRAASSQAQDLITAQTALGDSATDAKTKLEAYRTLLEEGTGSTLNMQEAQDRAAGAVNQAATKLEENGGKLAGNTQKALDNRAALRDVATAYIGLATETYKQTGKQELANRKIKEGRDKLYNLAIQSGLSKQAAWALVDQLLKIPGKYKATVALGMSKADRSLLGRLERVLNQWDLLKGATPGSPASARAREEYDKARDQLPPGIGSQAPGARATGGAMYDLSRPWLVGERGPERLRWNSSGTAAWVTPGTGSVPAPRAAQGRTVTINAPITVSGTNLGRADVEQAVARGFREFVREVEMA